MMGKKHSAFGSTWHQLWISVHYFLMSLLPKRLLVFIISGLMLLFAVCALVYLSGGPVVEAVLRKWADGRVESIVQMIEYKLSEQQNRLVSLARGRSLSKYVRGGDEGSGEVKFGLPQEARAQLETFWEANREDFVSITCLNSSGQALFRLSGSPRDKRVFWSNDMLPGYVPDERLWGIDGGRRSPIGRSPDGTTLFISAPIPAEQPQAEADGSLVLEIRLNYLIERADESTALPPSGEMPTPLTIALDNASGDIAYHPNAALRYQKVTVAMPSFESIARRMRAGASGHADYQSPSGKRWITSFSQVHDLPLSIAVAENYTAMWETVRRTALWGGGLAIVIASALLILTFVIPRLQKKPEKSSLYSGATAQSTGELPNRGSSANEESDVNTLPRNKVFISYSHLDRKWLNELQKYLVPLENDNVVKWDDTMILPGQDWQAEIDNALRVAKVAVLLVSENFMASDYVRKYELPALLATNILILPVIIRPCDLGRLSNIQTVNPPSKTMVEMTKPNQARVWLELVDRIKAALSSK